MNKFEQIFNILLKEYGQQGWWPVNGSYFSKIKNNNDIFEICTGAILTQNTSWTNVEKALKNLHPISPEKIKDFEEIKLKQAIKPAGYFNQKANYLKIFTDYFQNLNTIPTRDELLSIKGIGNETADSILLYAFKQPEFVIDLYTKRLFERLGLIKNKSYLETKDLFEKNLNKDSNIFQEYHALIVEHSKRFCQKQPKCSDCPLNKICNQSQ